MPNNEPFLVLGLGEILWDVLPEGKQLGGAPANFAYHAAALGARGVTVSAVGDDPEGREILATLDARGLDTSYIHVDRAHPTGTVTVTVDGSGVPAYTIHEGVAWDYIPFTDAALALARRANAICFGSLASRNPHSRETIRRLLDAAVPGCIRVLDVNLRQHYYSEEVILALLDRAEVLKLNEDELPAISDLLRIPGSTRERLNAMMDRFALDLIVLTRGGQGSILAAPGEFEEHPGTPVEKLADTVGAGDSFTAMAVMGLLRGWPLGVISERANRLAAHVCAHPGAMAPHPAGIGVR